MGGIVVVRTFGTRGEAEVGRVVLAANGVEAVVVADDCGAVDPALAFGRGVRLLVTEEDLERAERILEEAEGKDDL